MAKQLLTFWLIVRFFDGGELDPHIHERGWVSGSIYLQVPKHLDKKAGNLFISTNCKWKGVEDWKKIIK